MAINREQLKDVFNELGIGKNGFISIDEFSKLCDYFGMNMTTQVSARIILADSLILEL